MEEHTPTAGSRRRLPPTPVPGDFLIAAVHAHDDYFDQTVVVIVDVDENGALGVVLNRFASMELDDVLPAWTDVVSNPPQLFSGGPVTPDGALCLARLGTGCEEPLGWRRVFGEVGLLLLDTPVELVTNRYTAVRIYAGYAGWTEGQLDAELAAGMWYLVAGDPSQVFTDAPEDLWRACLRQSRSEMSLFSTWTADAALN